MITKKIIVMISCLFFVLTTSLVSADEYHFPNKHTGLKGIAPKNSFGIVKTSNARIVNQLNSVIVKKSKTQILKEVNTRIFSNNTYKIPISESVSYDGLFKTKKTAKVNDSCNCKC